MSTQRHYCTGCKQTKSHTRQYIVLPKGQVLRFCVKCAEGMTNIKPAVKQRVPERFL